MINDTVWQTQQLTQTYLNGVRGAIPLAHEQIELMLRLIQADRPQVTAVLDLGCGDGILGHAVLNQYPTATGIFLDFSPPMLAAARKRLSHVPQATFIAADYGQQGWQTQLPTQPLDVIVSGFSIHHQPDTRKKEIYSELYQLLAPGGIFLNLEHVASPTPWLETQFDTYFIDTLWAYHQQTNLSQSRDEVANNYYNRPDKAANILAPVETQCHWLRQIGFTQVDCYLKIFELALFGGIKKI